MKKRKSLVLDTAKTIIEEEGKVTTLEIKMALINTNPKVYWTQEFVSKTMQKFAETGKFNSIDRGSFKQYFSNKKNKKSKNQPTTSNVTKVTLTKLANLVEENAGKFLTIVHTKKNGDTNLMNVQIRKAKGSLGAFQCTEQGQFKQFYPKSLLEVRVGGLIFKKK